MDVRLQCPIKEQLCMATEASRLCHGSQSPNCQVLAGSFVALSLCGHDELSLPHKGLDGVVENWSTASSHEDFFLWDGWVVVLDVLDVLAVGI